VRACGGTGGKGGAALHDSDTCAPRITGMWRCGVRDMTPATGGLVVLHQHGKPAQGTQCSAAISTTMIY